MDKSNKSVNRVTQRVMLVRSLEEISEMDPDRIENPNFKIADEILKKHFGEHMKEGRIQSVRIKKHMKKREECFNGFGFIELIDSVETVTKICRDLQGTVLDGHAHILQLCHAQKDEHAVKKAGKDKSSTKLLVRNVAFEATEKDLTQLFSPFGQVLERAKEGESLEELRAGSLARLAAQFTEEQNGFQDPAKLSKRGRTSLTWTKKA